MPCEEINVQPYFEIAAPYPNLQTTILLKNPYVGDSESLTDSVTTKRATDGSLYSYVKTKNGRRKLHWEFTLSRNKCIELEGFIKSYFASKLRIVDHNGRIWIGYFTGNPFDFSSKGIFGPALDGWPVGEEYSFAVDFEGTEVI